MYYSKAKIITNTNTHSGRFVKIVALVDTVINTLTSDVITGTTTSITLKHIGNILKRISKHYD